MEYGTYYIQTSLCYDHLRQIKQKCTAFISLPESFLGLREFTYSIKSFNSALQFEK
jgi:hypothetical protein